MLAKEHSLKLVAQQALLGAIGKSILGISLLIDNELFYLNVYYEDSLDSEQIEALDATTTEILSHVLPDFQDVQLKTYFIDGKFLPRQGVFVFARLGMSWE